ncbi:hypothetical protein BVRB_9g207850 isoform A [Beta vulgaris subsp. vulgaris]|nr:hypothetical protein BVRB_9g207850 isoform A [Beta vulgaris subsp. vulgaris]
MQLPDEMKKLKEQREQGLNEKMGEQIFLDVLGKDTHGIYELMDKENALQSIFKSSLPELIYIKRWLKLKRQLNKQFKKKNDAENARKEAEDARKEAEEARKDAECAKNEDEKTRNEVDRKLLQTIRFGRTSSSVYCKLLGWIRLKIMIPRVMVLRLKIGERGYILSSTRRILSYN